MMTSLSNTTAAKLDNFFALFDLPVAFDIDNSLLEQRMRELQQQYHPDNMASPFSMDTNNTDAKGSTTDAHDGNKNQNSALINHAYQTLRHPDTKASYLLQMQNQDAELNNSISDLQFLESAMDLRVELDDTESAAQLSTLIATVNTQIDKYAQEFKSAYQDKQWQSAIDATQKLKFLVKLVKDIQHKIDALLTAHDDDDDLYI